MKKILVLFLSIAISYVLKAQGINPITELRKYNIQWNTPSKNSLGSMPIGNGDIGLNVWVEEDGSLNFYIGKTDAFNDLHQLLKLGKVRISFSDDPLLTKEFIQQLDLENGQISIKGKDGFSCKIYVDAFHPVVRVESKADRKFALNVSLILWRKEPRFLSGNERKGVYGFINYPDSLVVYPDTILASGNELIWCHRNEYSYYNTILESQNLGSIISKHKDPLQGRTFGGLINGNKMTRLNDTTLKSEAPALSQNVSIAIQTNQTPTIAGWLRGIRELVDNDRKINKSAAYGKHKVWWNSFWKKSYIFISGSKDAELITQAYIMQRFITACASRGALPPKFNGSIFNIDSYEEMAHASFNVDYRRWGGGYWFQNTRLMYWPLLHSGDFNLMTGLFRMYMDALPLAKERTKLYFNHGGSMFPETQTFWGTYLPDNYGWKRTASDTVGLPQNKYLKRYYQSILELSAMMLEYYSFTQSRPFLRDTLQPFIGSTLKFYNEHYSVKNGKLYIYPAQSLETYWDVSDPTPEIAGLHCVLNELLKITTLDPDLNKLAIKMRNSLPEVPVSDSNGKRTIDVAGQVFSIKTTNQENPELYAVFPYKIYTVGKKDLQMAQHTFSVRRFPGNGCWRQDVIQAAYLGLTSESKTMLIQLASMSNKDYRFPAFWGHNYDWLPDQDHGGVIMMALQAMLLQSDGEKLHLLPSFPKEWNVSFRLFTDKNKIVTAQYDKGKKKLLLVSKNQ